MATPKKASKTTGDMPLLKITLVKSVLGRTQHQRKVALGLGLKKRLSSVVVPQTPTIMGMVNRISHLIETEPVAS